MRWTAALCGAAILLATVTAHGQGQPDATRRAADLTAIPIAAAASTQELTIRWTPYPGAAAAVVSPTAAAPAGALLLVDRRAVPGDLPRQRNPQLSSDQLVAITIDSTGRELDWQLVKDPRVIRAESPGADGQLSGQVLHRTDVEFLLTMPAGTTGTAVRIYEPAWTGAEFLLRYLGAIALDQPIVR